ncbi:hypothetical protein J8I87_42600 [Paraburkholderia sp. LEh10]|uniref:hypothetical protein n=1 Tax=Paraburkholderia sp. LEh10 TaxID=2821353 RepID=UPI001AE5036A|nr:hypothetical protein [Paraburkholderia sp. LEh10]MBP0596174.1 hypothetical protein [Paraburkholderia sp. LEh10]
MYPLTWLWCPQYHYSLSGTVDQTMELRGSRNPQTEKSITQRYSYGSQLKRILAVLEPIAEEFYKNHPHDDSTPAKGEFDHMLNDIKAIRSVRQTTKSEKTWTASDIAEVMTRWKDESKRSTYLVGPEQFVLCAAAVTPSGRRRC